MILELFIILLGILATGFWVRRNPETAERVYAWLERSRKAIGAIVLVLLAWTFVASGNLLLQTAAFVLVVLGALYLFVEKPHRNLGGV